MRIVWEHKSACHRTNEKFLFDDVLVVVLYLRQNTKLQEKDLWEKNNTHSYERHVEFTQENTHPTSDCWSIAQTQKRSWIVVNGETGLRAGVE